MMEKNGRMQELDSLQKLLDGHGGDRTRWPASERLRFAPLIGGDEEARRRIAEAEALARILAKAPTLPEPRRAALSDRIVTLAQAEVLAQRARGDVVVPFGAVGRRRMAQRVMARAPAAALLAASLLVGVFVGFTGVAAPALQRFATLAGLSQESDAVGPLAAFDEASLAGEEDAL